MTRRLIGLLIALCALSLCGITAFASEEIQIEDIAQIEVMYEDILPSKTMEKTTYPLEVRTEDSGSYHTIQKIYEVPPDFDPADLIEAAFEDAGFSFAYKDTYQKVLPSSYDTKIVSETRQFETSSKDKGKILAEIPALLDYAENGYTGQLQMDSGTLVTDATGHTAYQYTVTSTQPYVPLDRNDPVYMEKSKAENGVDMQLVDVEWSANSQTVVGNSLIPTSYHGDAVYQGVATGYRATGYVTTVTYIGEVKQEIPGNIQYTIVYSGEEIPPPEEPAPLPVVPIAAGTGLAGSSVYVVFFFFLKKNAKIYNQSGGQYLLIDKQRVKANNPHIDLTPSKSRATTNAYLIVLDRTLARSIFGRTIQIDGGSAPLTHLVQGSGGAYQFEVII